MINDASLKAVAAASFGSHFCRPLYDSYSFARIPRTIEGLLTGNLEGCLPTDVVFGREYDRVIFFLIDGFGWQFFKKYAERFPFLQQIAQHGRVSQLTSQFPSTTTAHLTCLHTGLEVGQSGLYEWFYYEPMLDEIIAPLMFSHAGDLKRNTLTSTGLSAQDLFCIPSLYPKFASKGIKTRLFHHKLYAYSPFSQVMSGGAEIVPYGSFEEALQILRTQLDSPANFKEYNYLYFSEIDYAGHHFGPESQEVEAAIASCFKTLEEFLGRWVDDKDERSALILTADHGQTSTNPATCIYLNLALPEIIPLIKRNRHGQLLAPAGSPRDFFLHIQEPHKNFALELLRTSLKDRGEVYFTEELIEQGFFGSLPPSERFLERVGNIVILPYKGESVFWFEKNRFESLFFGNHGGLTREEMEIPFLFI